MLEGPAGTGKTTFLNATLDMIGERNWAQVTLQDLAEARFAPALLENKLVGTFDDLGNKPMKTVTRIKALTGGHPWLTVERKHEDQYDAPLYAKLLFTCNEMPLGADKSQAWLDRLCLIPFNNRFRDTEADDKDMPAKLATSEALEFLFVFAVSGLKTLTENDWQFPEPESVEVELEDYNKRNDTVAAFVDECCTVMAGLKAERGQWYSRYYEWAEASGLYPISKSKAFKRLREDYECEDYQNNSGKRFFKGIGLRAE
ncbi:hypothetical protein AKJ51_03485 [candidate division MSBL1 archaeon SCGC-AAA382A20]|uniref:SF3 helicase domain-containing protein n=1 Tax=candidate division MSBL1 archaeon SCGC-AAA382A20 TaxID=1698280 RepID=A0A133VJI5_9EURY|nr:hypothetical protein AKJ51_03485 [candidate division MSBL1 archaeon SCGC-AAA382A20]